MMKLQDIDVSFDTRTDSNGKDPDSASITLKAFHQALWSKQLPNGDLMELSTGKGYYLKWNDMYFGSDSFIVSFMHARYKLRHLVKESIPDFDSYRENYLKKACTISGYVIFPQVKWSMNQARGCSRKICDRWDLTLECIRRFYAGEPTPLDTALQRSKRFFDLFVDFKGYVDFFLLQDCVDENYNVKLWLETPLFKDDPMPESVEEYKRWIDTELEFVEKRGRRIKEYCGIIDK